MNQKLNSSASNNKPADSARSAAVYFGKRLLTFATAIILGSPQNVHGAVVSTDTATTPQETAVTRHVKLVCTTQIEVPEHTKRLNVWIPIAREDADQKVLASTIDTDVYHLRQHGADKNQFYFVTFNHPKEGKIALSTETEVERSRTECRGECECTVARSTKRWLKDESLVKVDESVRDQAATIVKEAHANTPLEKGRAIYDYVVSTMKYDKSGQGWGRGDLARACVDRTGNCTDFHSLFIGLCRAQNIPARFHIGLVLPTATSGAIEGYHCWADFLADNFWIPVDTSEAFKHQELKKFYFGHLDPNRVELSQGRDILLVPHQSNGPLNFFVNPYAEADGKPVSIATHYEYSDMK